MKNIIRRYSFPTIFFSIMLIILFTNRPAFVNGISMYPTLKHNEFVTYNSFETAKINDVVIIKSDSFLSEKYIIKRIIDMNDNQIFVEGDNKEFSCDSRNFGWIDKELIVGVVHYI